METQKKVTAFVDDLRNVVEKHFGALPPEEVEPFGMQLRKALPMVTGDSSVTTSATVTLLPNLDTDPPDSDD